MPLRIFRSGLVLGLLVSCAFAVWVLFRVGGLQYYRTPLAVRGYHALHRSLRPSGPLGQTFGVIGGGLMLVPFLYMLRKKLVRWTWLGSMRGWLEVHLFCGIVGPALITFHTSFKFNGIVSTAYWAMVIVVLSGFIGRYLYVRIPRSLRGTELTHAELDARANTLLGELSGDVSREWLERMHAGTEPRAASQSMVGLLFGEAGLRMKLWRLSRELGQAGVAAEERHRLMHLATERAFLMRRVAYLEKTKVAFGMWHVFHVPLVYFLLLIACVHVGITLYMGYVPFRW